MNSASSKKISIEKYKKRYSEDRALFSDAELKELRTKSAQTGAGFLALKNALIDLVKQTENISLSHSDIELSHKDNGAPNIKSIKKIMQPKDLFFSISHTKKTAVALAVVRHS